MKYDANHAPLVCMQTTSYCYRGTKPMTVRGVLWHSTGANNPNLSRYIQPADNAPDREEMLKLIGVNKYGNDYNHGQTDKHKNMGVNAWVGRLADGTVAAVQALPWGWKPWGCGGGAYGSCNDGWIQFEICEDGLSDAAYAAEVYREACELTAYLCAMYHLDPLGTVTYKGRQIRVILDHRQSHLLGFGNNHGDVQHWFPAIIGKTLDDIQQDVARLMDGADGDPGVGVPAGGTVGQVLTKTSGTDYDTEWTTPSGGDVTDVQVNGASIVTDGVANVPVAGDSIFGVVKVGNGMELYQGAIRFRGASPSDVKVGTQTWRVVTPSRIYDSVFYGLASAAGDTTQRNSSNVVGTYTDEAKSAISQMLNAPVTVTGSTPTITALPGVRYVCSEVTTLDITLPASGCIDVVFESGSTATALTITPPTGVTLKWANGFDPSALDANTTYEINICDGLGVAASWT